MSRRLLLFTAFAFGCYGFAQPKLTFQSPRKLIKLNLAATDAKGDPVTDLRVADVQVREDGKVRPVVFFRFTASKSVAAPEPGQFVTRPAPPATFIVLDRWNERMMTAASAWNDIDAALKGLESVDRVYIYILTNHGDLFPVHSLPVTDADVREGPPPTPADLVAKLDDAVRKLNGLRMIDVQDPILQINTTFQALSGLVNQMATVPGRKNLIWVTHGVPLTTRVVSGEFVDITPQIRGLSAAATQCQIVFYTVAQSGQGAGADLSNVARETLEMFAALTGGRFYASGNADRAIADSIRDSRANYRLAYYSAIGEKDRKQHKIRVEAVRKGVHLSAPESYPGDADEPDTDEAEGYAFSNESRSAFDATDIGLRVTVSHNAAAGTTHFDIAVDPDDVLIEHLGDSYLGALDMRLAFYNEGFSSRPSPPPTHLEINLTPEQFTKAAHDWIHFSETVSLNGPLQKIRLMVFDRGMRGLGSVTLPAK